MNIDTKTNSVPGQRGPLRVVSIAHAAFVEGSGRTRYNAFASDPGIDLTLVIPDRWNEPGRTLKEGIIPPEVPIKKMPVALQAVPKAGWYMHVYPGMRRMLDELRPQVLHLWEEPWSLVAAQAAFLCRTRNISLVLETEQNILRELPFPFQQLRRYSLQRTNLLIARQREALEVSRACGYTGPATIVEYFVDQSCFRPRDREAARQAFPTQGFTIGYVGRLIPEKGLFTVLDAIKACRNPVNFVMMGAGNASESLHQRIRDLGLDQRVRIIGSESQDGVALFMNSLDALVLMSETTKTWKEQFGRVIIEAQACGVPVIGSSSGAIPSVVGEGGWIVQERDASQLATLLEKLSSQPAYVAEAGAKALRHINRFSREQIARCLRSAWVSAAQGTGSTSFENAPQLVRSKLDPYSKV